MYCLLVIKFRLLFFFKTVQSCFFEVSQKRFFSTINKISLSPLPVFFRADRIQTKIDKLFLFFHPSEHDTILTKKI